MRDMELSKEDNEKLEKELTSLVSEYITQVAFVLNKYDAIVPELQAEAVVDGVKYSVVLSTIESNLETK